MSVLVASLQGRFGNQVMQYLFARAFAECFGYTLKVEPWAGERVFQIEHLRPDIAARETGAFKQYSDAELAGACSFSRYLENTPFFGQNQPNIIYRGYGQTQFNVSLYTKRDAQKWLQFRPEIEASACAAAAADCNGVPDVVVCHQRRGDYAGYGYPVVSQQSYPNACAAYGLEWNHPGMSFLTEEDPTPHSPLPDDLSFVADFYRMVKAPTLLRGNSTFSWLAALLGNGLVLSPVIDGLEGGKEHDCQFVAGNHPRLANFDFTTDLYVSP